MEWVWHGTQDSPLVSRSPSHALDSLTHHHSRCTVCVSRFIFFYFFYPSILPAFQLNNPMICSNTEGKSSWGGLCWKAHLVSNVVSFWLSRAVMTTQTFCFYTNFRTWSPSQRYFHHEKEKPESRCAREEDIIRSLRNRWNSSAWVEYIVRCSSAEESPCRARYWRIWTLRQKISFHKVIDNPLLPSDLVSCKFKQVVFLLICSIIGNGSLELMEKREKKK